MGDPALSHSCEWIPFLSWLFDSIQGSQYRFVGVLLLISSFCMPARRLNDRISILCESALHLSEGAELTNVLRELREALHEQNRRLRERLRAGLLNRRTQNKQSIKTALIRGALRDLPEA
jgi:hypothetical protein